MISRRLSSNLNCVITIDTVSRAGQRGRVQFRTKLNSAVECRLLASFHQPNFEPQRIAAKQVAFQWTGQSAAKAPLSRRRARWIGRR